MASTSCTILAGSTHSLISAICSADPDRLFAVMGDFDLMAVHAKHVRQSLGHIPMVVDDENSHWSLRQGMLVQAAASLELGPPGWPAGSSASASLGNPGIAPALDWAGFPAGSGVSAADGKQSIVRTSGQSKE